MTPVEHLDLATVLNVSRAVSGETDLEKLIATILRLSLEHAGADRGLLILPSGDTYRIKAEAKSHSDGTLVELRQAGVTSADLPESVFHNVLRTSESVLLQEASGTIAFSDDEYMRRHRVRSVVCLPLLKQTQLVGVIYLENRVTSGALTAARMALLELLATEAAISLENERLYRDLREREAKVRRLVDANIIGIFTWHTDGRVFEANEEFLRIIGYSHEDLISGRLRWTDFTLPEWRERDARVMPHRAEPVRWAVARTRPSRSAGRDSTTVAAFGHRHNGHRELAITGMAAAIANAANYATGTADPVAADLDREGARTRIREPAHQFVARGDRRNNGGRASRPSLN